ncbi:MAG TPA: hypothetical protein PKY30_06995, partial [Myxococcota bacterium]|nr:hypothetical protein [Myxococcota bacterium]
MDYTDAVWISLGVAKGRLARRGKSLSIPLLRGLRVRFLLRLSPRWTPRALAAEAWLAKDLNRAHRLLLEAENDARSRRQEWDAAWIRRQREFLERG